MPGNILLLQGPMGPFFKRLSRDLESQDDNVVYKINFNAGDWLFYRGKRAVNYRGTLEQWQEFLADRIVEWQIDTLYLFGDNRAHHLLAREVAQRLSIRLGVFEEGYLRPYYVTLEAGGVNKHSPLPRDPEFYRQLPVEQEPAPIPIPRSYSRAAWYANWYYIAGWLGRRHFSNYQHHRPFNPYHECFLWCRAAFRKYYYRLQQRGILNKLETGLSGKYYLAPLQVHCDGQIRTCEHVASTAAFIRRTIGSFARNAPADTQLVFKHHPLDRGYSDYTKLIQKLTRRYECQDRVIYVHDLHLPTLLDHALGTIVVNSTVGLSSLLHKTPAIALGHAVYDIPGMTFQGKLDDFWQAPGSVDSELNLKFRSYLLHTNQINGNFYTTPAEKTTETGMDVHSIAMNDSGYSVRKQVAPAAPAEWADITWHQNEPVLQTASGSLTAARSSSYADGQAVAVRVDTVV